MTSIRSALAEAGEVTIGLVWWGGSHLWGLAVGLGLLLAPLLLAVLAATALDGLSADAAISIGVVAAFALGLPPWDADSRLGLPLVIAGASLSAVAWDLTRGGASLTTLGLAFALSVVGFGIRRAYRRLVA